MKLNKKALDNAKYFDIKKLIDNHPDPEKWIKHIDEDLMKYWMTEEAKDFDLNLFSTYRANNGKKISKNPSEYPKEIVEALNSNDTKGLIDLDENYIRSHSRQTFGYGIAYNMTGKTEYLELCKKGAEALMLAFDKENGMFTKQNDINGEWSDPIDKRTSQDLAYGVTGIGMYYYLTHDEKALFKLLQAKNHIFNQYLSYGRGYFTWYPKTKDNQTDDQVEIVAQLDQIYAYMIWLTPALPEPYQTDWKNSLKEIVNIIITRFYSERYGFFWGTNTDTQSMQLGTDHTDFGHSIKTMWLIYEVGLLTKEIAFVDFARPKIDKILKKAYIEENGSWARRFREDGTLDRDKEWWGLAELDQACAILSLNDPSYLSYLNNTYDYWFKHMIDKEYGEIWHMVLAKDDMPDIKYPKIHSWKNCLHSTEHALFGYIIASQIKNKEFTLYYAFKSKDDVCYKRVAPYLFRANITKVEEIESIKFMENGNKKIAVSYYSLH